MTKRILKTAISSGVPFGFMMALFFSWRFGPIGAIAGALSGVCFGIFIGIFIERQRPKLEAKDQIFEGEKIILQGPANHFKKMEARGGWLVLTDTKLAFRSHGVNLQNEPLNIHISEISSLAKGVLGRVIPRRLSLVLQSGKRETFMVAQRGEWTKLLAERIHPTKRT